MKRYDVILANVLFFILFFTSQCFADDFTIVNHVTEPTGRKQDALGFMMDNSEFGFVDLQGSKTFVKNDTNSGKIIGFALQECTDANCAIDFPIENNKNFPESCAVAMTANTTYSIYGDLRFKQEKDGPRQKTIFWIDNLSCTVEATPKT